MDRQIGRILSLLPSSTIDTGLKALRRFRLRDGRHIYDHNWDVLVILDACRYDMYREVVGAGESVLSVASTSTEWMDVTFDDTYTSETTETAYISANPFSHRLDESRFGLIDHVWQDHWDDDLGTIPANPVTDHGIAVARSGKFDRVILHYMQPHFPFIGGTQFGHLGREAFDIGRGEGQNIWRMVESGTVDSGRAIEAYYDNLQYVFEFVKILMDNVDGQVVISADHANALGEWNMWGHRAYVPFHAVREVPWDERDCVDSETYEPDVRLADLKDDRTTEDVNDRLRSLGYV